MVRNIRAICPPVLKCIESGKGEPERFSHAGLNGMRFGKHYHPISTKQLVPQPPSHRTAQCPWHCVRLDEEMDLESLVDFRVGWNPTSAKSFVAVSDQRLCATQKGFLMEIPHTPHTLLPRTPSSVNDKNGSQPQKISEIDRSASWVRL